MSVRGGSGGKMKARGGKVRVNWGEMRVNRDGIRARIFTWSIVSRTGINPVFSVPGWSVINLRITFFKYSKLWILSFLSWFFSKRRISVFRRPVCSLKIFYFSQSEARTNLRRAFVASLSRSIELWCSIFFSRIWTFETNSELLADGVSDFK